MRASTCLRSVDKPQMDSGDEASLERRASQPRVAKLAPTIRRKSRSNSLEKALQAKMHPDKGLLIHQIEGKKHSETPIVKTALHSSDVVVSCACGGES